MIAVRSLFAFGLVSFVPLYLVKVRGVPKREAALAVTAMLLAGAVATLAGGRLADRFGRRAVLVGALLPLAPLLAFFLHAPGIAGLATLVLIGGCTVATYSVAVVMGQEYLPGREGIAGGVTMGLAIGVGGAGVPAFGRPRRPSGRRVGPPRPGDTASARRGARAHASRTAALDQTGSPERRVRYAARSSPTSTNTSPT